VSAAGHLAARAHLIAELSDAGARDTAELVRSLPALDQPGAREEWREILRGNRGVISAARRALKAELPEARSEAWRRAMALAVGISQSLAHGAARSVERAAPSTRRAA
jgi:hypothetical protein